MSDEFIKRGEPLIQDFDAGMICDYFGRLERQGPGNPEATIRALSFIDGRSGELAIADLACGTGGQTMVLARNTAGRITGLDIFPDFIDRLRANAARSGFGDRIDGVVGSMDDLPFDDESLDVIWCEGAIGNIGFKNGLNHWKRFLRRGGYVAVTYESWLTDGRPDEIERFWLDAVPEMDTIGHNIETIQNEGYGLVAAFTLPEECWTESYFTPQKKIQQKFLDDNAGNEKARAFVDYMNHEAELYARYKEYYGYVFYVARKIGSAEGGDTRGR